jgi:hypothetical protein
MAQARSYYEANCGQCGAFLYGALTGTYFSRVNCPACKTENLFSTTAGEDSRCIRGQVAAIENGNVHTAGSPISSH